MPIANEMLRQQLCSLHVVRANRINIIKITGTGSENHRDSFFFCHPSQVIATSCSSGNYHTIDTLIQ